MSLWSKYGGLLFVAVLFIASIMVGLSLPKKVKAATPLDPKYYSLVMRLPGTQDPNIWCTIGKTFSTKELAITSYNLLSMHRRCIYAGKSPAPMTGYEGGTDVTAEDLTTMSSWIMRHRGTCALPAFSAVLQMRADQVYGDSFTTSSAREEFWTAWAGGPYGLRLYDGGAAAVRTYGPGSSDILPTWVYAGLSMCEESDTAWSEPKYYSLVLYLEGEMGARTWGAFGRVFDSRESAIASYDSPTIAQYKRSIYAGKSIVPMTGYDGGMSVNVEDHRKMSEWVMRNRYTCSAPKFSAALRVTSAENVAYGYGDSYDNSQDREVTWNSWNLGEKSICLYDGQVLHSKYDISSDDAVWAHEFVTSKCE